MISGFTAGRGSRGCRYSPPTGKNQGTVGSENDAKRPKETSWKRPINQAGKTNSNDAESGCVHCITWAMFPHIRWGRCGAARRLGTGFEGVVQIEPNKHHRCFEETAGTALEGETRNPR